MSVPHSCLTCEEIFSTYYAARSHSRVAKHVLNPCVCQECKAAFSTAKDLQMHLRIGCSGRLGIYDGRDDGIGMVPAPTQGQSHAPPLNLRATAHCPPCRRDFVSVKALQQHIQASPKHNPNKSKKEKKKKKALDKKKSATTKGRNLKCPFCVRMFKTPSAIANHIESGLHKSNRHQVTAAVHAMKIVPNISVKLLAGPVEPPKTLTTYIATEVSFNGTTYTCSVCHKDRFQTLQALHGHLNSPAHDDDEFRCPKCKKKFTLISGFVQHLESRACGLAKSGQVNHYFNDLSGQFSRMLTV